MFELIGIFFATLFLCALATGVAVVLGLSTWLILRNGIQRKRLTLFAASFPFAVAAYWWLCTALLPGSSFFGDIDEPLPNGYHVTALGKMPEYGIVKPTKDDVNVTVPSPFVDRIGVHDDLILGHLRVFNTEPAPSEPFFQFDTRSDTITTFASQHELEMSLHHPVQLKEIQYFQSPLAHRRNTQNLAIFFAPPMLGFLLLASSVIRAKRVPGLR